MAAWLSVVTDLVVLSSKDHLPGGYQLIDIPIIEKTDSSSNSESQRHLAYCKELSSTKLLAITDIQLIEETDVVPPGYRVLHHISSDDVEAFSNKTIITKKEGWCDELQGIPHALTDIMILHNTMRDELPNKYKMLHGINGYHVCFKASELGGKSGDSSEEETDSLYLIPQRIVSSKGNHKVLHETSLENDSKKPTPKKRTRSAVKSSISTSNGVSTSNRGGNLYPQESESLILRPFYENFFGETSGYPLKQFLDPPPPSCLCPKCHSVLRKPCLLSCCKTHVCEECVLQIQLNKQSCPQCKKEGFDCALNSYQKEKIDKLMIRCEKHEDGCTWEGNLADLQCHLLNHCSYIEIDCQNKCGSRFVRHRMSQHKCTKKQSSVDEKRVLSLEEITDKILSLEKKQEREMSVLKPELTKFNTTMNNGSVTSDKQMKLVLEVHALKQKLAESEIRGNALAVKVKQQEQEMKVFRETQNEFRHQFDNLVDQLQLKLSSSLPISPISFSSSPTLNQPPCEFVMEEFSIHQFIPDDEWFSEPFVSSSTGYKFCLQVVANGMMSSAGCDVSICIKLMRGEYDNRLKWPFQGEITVQILNWRSDQKHATRVINFNSAAKKYGACDRIPSGCPGDRAPKGWGVLPFIPHSYLPYNESRNTEFVRNNCLCLRVTNVIVHST